MNTSKTTETLRSSFTPDGQRVFLEFDGAKGVYRLATRWAWLVSFDNVWDACDAFEALEMAEGDLRAIAKVAKAEIIRVPRSRFVRVSGGGAMGTTRMNYLINSIERRLAGMRPVRCGSKGSVEKWVAV